MMFTMNRERDQALTVSLAPQEQELQSVQIYIRGLKVGSPPQFGVALKQEIQKVQPHDILDTQGAEALTNITYNQDQLDCISYHCIAIRQALMPVVAAFAPSPRDMGMVMNFCT
jgi:hypothetical protein